MRILSVITLSACGTTPTAPPLRLDCAVVVDTAYDRALTRLATYRPANAASEAELIPQLKIAVARECQAADWSDAVRECVRDSDGITISPCERLLSPDQTARLDRVFDAVVEPWRARRRAAAEAALPPACVRFRQAASKLQSCDVVPKARRDEVFHHADELASMSTAGVDVAASCQSMLDALTPIAPLCSALSAP